MVITIVTMSIVVVVAIFLVCAMVTSMASSSSVLIFVLMIIMTFLNMMRCVVCWDMVTTWCVMDWFGMPIPCFMVSRSLNVMLNFLVIR